MRVLCQSALPKVVLHPDQTNKAHAKNRLFALRTCELPSHEWKPKIKYGHAPYCSIHGLPDCSFYLTAIFGKKLNKLHCIFCFEVYTYCLCVSKSAHKVHGVKSMLLLFWCMHHHLIDKSYLVTLNVHLPRGVVRVRCHQHTFSLRWHRHLANSPVPLADYLCRIKRSRRISS